MLVTPKLSRRLLTFPLADRLQGLLIGAVVMLILNEVSSRSSDNIYLVKSDRALLLLLRFAILHVMQSAKKSFGCLLFFFFWFS